MGALDLSKRWCPLPVLCTLSPEAVGKTEPSPAVFETSLRYKASVCDITTWLCSEPDWCMSRKSSAGHLGPPSQPGAPVLPSQAPTGSPALSPRLRGSPWPALG